MTISLQKVIVWLIWSAGAIGFAAVSLSFFDQLACEGQLLNINFEPTSMQEIRGEQFISQSFEAPRNDLNRVDVLLQTYGRVNDRDVTVQLLELPPGTRVPNEGIEKFSTIFNAASVTDQTWRKFSFPPIADSAGKSYLIMLKSPRSEPGNAITVGGIDKDIYPHGQAFLGSSPVGGDIAFRACFDLSVAKRINLLLEQLTQNRPGVWGSSWFYIVTILIYGLLLIGFFGWLTKCALEDR